VVRAMIAQYLQKGTNLAHSLLLLIGVLLHAELLRKRGRPAVFGDHGTLLAFVRP